MTEYIVGPQGPQGIRGERGPEGYQGIQGTPGDKGSPGSGGTSLQIQGTVPTYAALPLSGVNPNEAYVTADTGKLWIWSGNHWMEAGQFRGHSGDPGQPGQPGTPGRDGMDGRPGPPGEVKDLSLWIYSQADNLVANGNGYLRDKTNFSLFNSISLSDVATGSFASFKATTPRGFYTTDDKIPLAIGESYQFRFWIKQTVDGKETTPFSAGLAPIDAYGNSIYPQHYTFLPNTTTTLAQDLNPGDSTIKLTSSVNWYDDVDSSKRALIFWNYTDPVGKLWEPHTYSRNVSPENAWGVGGINRTTHTITLSSPWNLGPVGAGTSVSNSALGSKYLFSQTAQQVGMLWTAFEREFDAKLMESKTASDGRVAAAWLDGLPPGTSTVKPIWVLNDEDLSTSSHAICGVFISSIAALRVKTKTATERALEAKAMAETLETDLADAKAEISSSRSELDQTKIDLTQAQTDLQQAMADAQEAWNKSVDAENSVGGKNSLIVSVEDPVGTTHPNTGQAFVVGDSWTKVDSLTTNNAVASWYWDGNEWKPQLIKNELIHSLDVTKLQAGAAHIQQAVVNQLVADIGFFNAVVADTVTAQNIAAAIANIIEARVENLTVTAGATINSAVVQKLAADLIVAQVLRTSTDPVTGLYALMDNAGFRVIRDGGELQESVVHLGPTAEGLLTLGTNPSRRITLDNTGGGSFNQVSAEQIILQGQAIGPRLDSIDDEIVSFHQWVKGEVSVTRRGRDQIMGLDAYLRGGYVYRVEVSGMTIRSIGTGEPGVGLHITLDGSYPGDNWSASQVKETSKGVYDGYRTHEGMWYDVDLRHISPSVITHLRAGITLRDWTNTVDCQLYTSNNVPQFEVTRRGKMLPDRGTRNIGVVGGGTPPPPPTTKTRRVVTFKATGWATYRENGALYNNSSNAPAQGDPQNGILQSSCYFFDSWREIMQGKTIHRISLFTWADYWYYNNGGLGKWHTHTQYGSIPSTQPAMTYLGISPRPYADANYYGDFWQRGARGRWDLRPDQFGWFRDTVRGFGFHAQGDRNPRYYGRFSNITGVDSPTLVEIDLEGEGNW